MNIFKRFAAGFKLATSINRETMSSDLLKALYRFMVHRTPMWIDVAQLDQYISQFYNKNSDFASVIDFRAEKGAMIPWKFYKLVKGEKEEITEGPMIDLWECPNPMQGGYEFRKEVLCFDGITGEGLVNGVPFPSGEWGELWAMPPQLTNIEGGGERKPIKSYTMTFDGNTKIPAEHVLHMKNFNPNYDNVGTQLRGQSKAKSLVMDVTASNSGNEAVVGDIQSGHMPGFLKLVDQEKNWAIEQIEKFQQKIFDSQSAESSGRIPFVNHDIQFVKIGETLVSLEIIEALLSKLRAVARRYGLSSRLLNDPAAATMNNMENDVKRAYEDCIKPMLKHFQDELNAWYVKAFAPEGEVWIMEPDYSNVQALQKNLLETAQAVRALDFLTLREKYRLAGIEPDDPESKDLDERIMPFTMSPLNPKPEEEEEEELTPEEEIKQILAEYRKPNGIYN